MSEEFEGDRTAGQGDARRSAAATPTRTASLRRPTAPCRPWARLPGSCGCASLVGASAATSRCSRRCRMPSRRANRPKRSLAAGTREKLALADLSGASKEGVMRPGTHLNSINFKVCEDCPHSSRPPHATSARSRCAGRNTTSLRTENVDAETAGVGRPDIVVDEREPSEGIRLVILVPRGCHSSS